VVCIVLLANQRVVTAVVETRDERCILAPTPALILSWLLTKKNSICSVSIAHVRPSFGKHMKIFRGILRSYE
jgi:hypothetical protein